MIAANTEGKKQMTEILVKVERLLVEIVSGNDDMISVDRVKHVLRVLRAQKEMEDEGLFDPN